MDKVFRLWKPVAFTDAWRKCDTSILDDIAPSWFARREKLQDTSTEFKEFLERLKREHAIETGLIEQLYDLDKGVTETLIKEGFVASYLSHGDTNIPIPKLLGHLNDQLEAMDFVFDMVKEDRPLSKSFIRSLHQLLTRHQESAAGRDIFGNRVEIPLQKGIFKTRENNPTSPNGIKILYCSPDHVEAEMDNLVNIFHQLLKDEEHPLIISSWFHHAFVSIHPFQDGNGRMARLLTSLILIKFGYFPITVLREEAKIKYIAALEKADNGVYQPLVSYFANIQRKNIEKVLNVKEVSGQNIEDLAIAFNKKIEQKSSKLNNLTLDIRRNIILDDTKIFLAEFSKKLEKKINHNSRFIIEDIEDKHKFINQDLNLILDDYASKNKYHINRILPREWVNFTITIQNNRTYNLLFVIHHFGYENSALAIGSILLFSDGNSASVLLEVEPYVTSIYEEVDELKKKNIKLYLEKTIAVALSQIASEF